MLLLLLLLLLLHHMKKEKEREINENEVETQYPFDPFFFFFKLIMRHRKSFECKIRCIASACGAIFIHDCEYANIALDCLFLYCTSLVCTVLNLSVKSGTSLFGIVLNVLLSCLPWLPCSLYLYQHCYAINRDPQKSQVIKVLGFCNEE